MVQLNAGRARARRSSIGEETHYGEGLGERDGFSTCIPPPLPPPPLSLGWLLSFPGISLLRFLNQTSESVMQQPRMSRENIVAFVMPAALYPSYATARREITIPE